MAQVVAQLVAWAAVDFRWAPLARWARVPVSAWAEAVLQAASHAVVMAAASGLGLVVVVVHRA